MPYPWDISRGKPKTIHSLVDDEMQFHVARIRRGDFDQELPAASLGAIADRIAAEALIPVPVLDLEGWVARMEEDSDANRVTYAIPFHGDEHIVRLALDWKSGGHAVTVMPDVVEYSIWSRDKNAAAIRSESDSVMTPVADRWADAQAQIDTYNADVQSTLLGALEERQHSIGDRRALLSDLNRRSVPE